MTIRVLVLTRDSCHYCDHAKEVLGRLAADFPLEVSELAIDSGRREFERLTGGDTDNRSHSEPEMASVSTVPSAMAAQRDTMAP